MFVSSGSNLATIEIFTQSSMDGIGRFEQHREQSIVMYASILVMISGKKAVLKYSMDR